MKLHITYPQTASNALAEPLSCLIVGAGPLVALGDGTTLPTHDMCIAADGGVTSLQKLGLTPDIIVGDFDSVSLGSATASLATTHRSSVVTLPACKDDTDMLSAVKLGWQRGARIFHIFGALGGRVDHTLANVQLLTFLARNGATGVLYSESQCITAIHNASLYFEPWDAPEHAYVSLLAAGDTAQGVSIQGLRYELSEGSINYGEITTVSNEFVSGQAASIEVRNGSVTVVFPRQTPEITVQHSMLPVSSIGDIDREVSHNLRA